MGTMRLYNLFPGAAAKWLTAADMEPKRSDGCEVYEIETTPKMRADFLGKKEREFDAHFYLWHGNSTQTFLDMLKVKHIRLVWPNRPGKTRKWVLRFQWSHVLDEIWGSVSLFVALNNKGELFFFMANKETTTESQLSGLLGIEPEGYSFVSQQTPLTRIVNIGVTRTRLSHLDMTLEYMIPYGRLSH